MRMGDLNSQSTADHAKANLSSLPLELLIHIVECVDYQRTIRLLLCLNRHFHWLLLNYFNDQIFRHCESQAEKPRIARTKLCVRLFASAIRTNSLNLIQYLVLRRPEFNAKHSMQHRYTIHRTSDTCLRWSFTGDAPQVAVFLVESGADVDQEMIQYPDLAPIYLALTKRKTFAERGTDTALRIACSYALPRTAAFLLNLGANPNAKNHLGLAAIHSTVMRRLPWPDYHKAQIHLHQRYGSHWPSDIHATLSVLIQHGADVNLTTQTTRIHKCDHACWKSLKCDHRGQTALHLAAMSGFESSVVTLLRNKADPNVANEDGLTPLYGALCQGHGKLACVLLKLSGLKNPVVDISERSTALHVACRFAYSRMVHAMLLQGIDVNVINSKGLTPLHEVLLQMQASRNRSVLKTIKLLAEFGADPDATTGTHTPRQLARKHRSPDVREMFTSVKLPTSSMRPLRPSKRSRDPVEQRGIGLNIEDEYSLNYPPLFSGDRRIRCIQAVETSNIGSDVVAPAGKISSFTREEPVPIWTKAETARIKTSLLGESNEPPALGSEATCREDYEVFPALIATHSEQPSKNPSGELWHSALFWGSYTMPKDDKDKRDTTNGMERPETLKNIQQHGGRRKNKKWTPLMMI
ncbi:ankyrin repeat-containing domain protein [Truncatella angustata]|uniref:Ankyrin repeat-containing domain protein n=1 Tax=Truncatella angustata TaxID=152316 RepID=A0A9P8UJE9_9PEZI|nr:ankyrin repeat-containing domain protein [Truncatella angustata]KAH6653558.1 ankyrin repeat-containing domain protein [Truncatella angustata]